jgi:hypothetical protein
MRSSLLHLAAAAISLCGWELAAGAPSVEELAAAGAKIKTENRRVDGYCGIWYSIGQPTPSKIYKYSGGLGTYCAKHNPFAVYCPQVDKTFFCYGGAVPEDCTRLVHMVSYYDHKTGRVPRPILLLDKQTDDAHDNPVISVDASGYVWIFSTSHGVDRPSFIHRSKEPYSIDAFERIEATHECESGVELMNNFSYFQVWNRGPDGFSAFFTHYRDPVDRTLMFAASADGRQWSKWQRIAAIGQGHYQVTTARGEHAASAFDFHPQGKGLDYRTNLYYVETTDGGRTWQTADGKPLELPLTTEDNPALVHDYRREGRNVYVKELQFDADGRPVVTLITSGGYKPGPENAPYTWTLYHWNGSKWETSDITDSDHNYDMGSLYIEDDAWRLIAPTEPGPQPYNTGGEMCMWVSRDQGRSWALDRELTADSETNHTFARRPVNAHPDFYALWADGDPTKKSQSRLYFCNRAGDVFQLPTKMTSDFAKPTPWPLGGVNAISAAVEAGVPQSGGY